MHTFFRCSFLLLLFMASCSVTQKTVQVDNNAHQAFLEKEYDAALTLYTQFIEMNSEDPLLIPDSIYRNAGIAAFHLQKTQTSLDFLNRIRSTETANAETHYALAVLNRSIDNLSREITALETYVSDFPEGDHIDEMRNRLFQTWVISRNYEKAFDLWPSVQQQASQKEPLLNDYFATIKALEKEELLFDTAQDLLTINPENTDALYYMAVHYFNKAESRYQTEMDEYEKNRTRRQYAQLLKGFEILNEDFRKSLNYFLKLYEVNPQPAYARYIGNIYLRFDDKEKARIYHDKADN